MKSYKILIILSAIVLMSSCEKKANEYDPYSIEGKAPKKKTNSGAFEVDFKKTDANVKTVHVKLNNANGYDAIFDTGCSGMLISSLEMINLIKSRTISENDFLGYATSTIADGSTKYYKKYNIKEVTLTDKQGNQHTVRDVAATVMDNPGADILIGTAVIDNLAKKSYTVDLSKKVIRFD